MKPEAPKNPMVEPRYVNPQELNILLTGNVLVFGSGQLTHERLFFNLNSPTKLILYDPFQETRGNGISKYFNKLDDALQEGPFNQVLCLFSLHYEPQWLFMLEKLFKALAIDGEIIFAEDRGFRCILDNGCVDDLITTEPWFKAFREEVSRVFFERAAQSGAPWYPDISASNYGLAFKILSLFAEKDTRPQKYVFERQPASDREPGCYLPWNRVVNPNLTDSHEDTIRNALAECSVVKEVVELTKFRKLRDMPVLCNIDSETSRAVWDIIVRHACGNVAKLRVCPALQHAPEARERLAIGFLQTAYLNLFRHFSSIGTGEIIIGFHSRLEKTGTEKRPKFDTELPSCRFNIEPRKLSIDFTPDEFLNRYLRSFENDKEKRFLAEQFDQIGISRLYLWPPPNLHHETLLPQLKRHVPNLVDISTDYPIDPALKLLRDFCVNTTPPVPPNLYALASLAHQYSSSQPTETHEKIDAACVIYFVHNRYNYTSHPSAVTDNVLLVEEIQPLVYTLASIVQPLVGQSAYLELALKQQFYEEDLDEPTEAALQGALYPERYAVEYQGEDYNPTVSISVQSTKKSQPVHHEKHKRLLLLIGLMMKKAPLYISKSEVCDIYETKTISSGRITKCAQTHIDDFRRYVRKKLRLNPDLLIKNVSGQGWCAADGLDFRCLNKNVNQIGIGKKSDWIVDPVSPEQDNLSGLRAKTSRRMGADAAVDD